MSEENKNENTEGKKELFELDDTVNCDESATHLMPESAKKDGGRRNISLSAFICSIVAVVLAAVITTVTCCNIYYKKQLVQARLDTVMSGKYGELEFKNVNAESTDVLADEEKSKLDEANKSAEAMLAAMKDAIGTVSAVRFSSSLSGHPVCLTSEGELSVEMERVLRKMPGAEDAPKASLALEINLNHPIKEKLFSLFGSDPATLAEYSKILYSAACLVSGVAVEKPSELCDMIARLMLK